MESNPSQTDPSASAGINVVDPSTVDPKFLVINYIIGLTVEAFVTAFRGIILPRIILWSVSYTLSITWFVRWYKYYIFVRILLVERYLPESLRAIRVALAGDGADNDTYGDVLPTIYSLSLYVTIVTMTCNLSAAMAFLRLCTRGSAYLITLWVIWKLFRRLMRSFTWPSLVQTAALNLLYGFAYFFGTAVAAVALGLVKLRDTCLPWIIKVYISLVKGTFALKARLSGDRTPEHWGHPYVYQPLESGRSIRLLKISRRAPFGSLACQIIHVPLEEAPQYEAISYCWGDLPGDQELSVNDYITKVTARVVEILHTRASYFDEKFVWIDSVCINQRDLVEKASQIRLMHQIYSRAHRVLAWLGDAPDARICISFVLKIFLQLKRADMTDEERKRILGIGSTDPGWQAFFHFLEHEYWSRAWIIQELAVAKDIAIAYGNEIINWRFIKSVFEGFKSHNAGAVWVMSESGMRPRHLMPLGAMHINVILELQRLGSPKLGGALSMLSTVRCKDPRDRVYSLLGLTTAGNDPLLAPDYTKPSLDVFVDVARYCLNEDVGMLINRAGKGWQSCTEHLPSWVPDLTCPIRTISLSDLGVDYGGTSYRAGGAERFVFGLHPRLPILVVSYVQFDSIAHLGPCFPIVPFATVRQSTEGEDVVTNWSTESIKAILDAVIFTADILGSDYISPRDQPLDEVVWRTLIGDRTPYRPYARPAPPVWGEYFASHCAAGRYFLSGEIPPNEVLKLFDVDFSPLGSTQLNHFSRAHGRMVGRRMAITRNGTICLVPHGACVGDVVGVARGYEACLVLRKEAAPASWSDRWNKESQPGLQSFARGALDTEARAVAGWRLVGEAYAHGYMDGEAIGPGRDWEEVGIW